MGGGRAGVGGEEGDVEGVVLWRVLFGGLRVGGSGRGTCLPMIPMQAIDGVVMVSNGD